MKFNSDVKTSKVFCKNLTNSSTNFNISRSIVIPKVQARSLMVDKVLAATIDIEKVTSQINSVANRVTKGEENVKIGIEKVLSDVAEKFGLQPAFYEYTFVDGGRADALYGKLIIEYEDLDSLQNKTKREHAIKQLKEYITKHSISKEDYRKHLGVAIDGKNILFVRYNEQINDWKEGKPLPINKETIGRLLEALRGLKRKPLDVDEMLHDFDPNSPIAKKIVQDLYKTPLRNNRSKVLFDDWKRVFNQAIAYSSDKTKGLELTYGISSGKIDYEKLVFSIHTYYAFLMKIVAADVVALYGQGRFIRSYFYELFIAQAEGKLKEKLEEIETGKFFRDFMNIENFMEADYFSWYIDEWNDVISDDLSTMINTLSNYEVATTDLKPEKVRDLFKRLYQNLMPKEIRRDMGEYYTPDWLAEIVLDEMGFTISTFEKIKSDNDFLPSTLRLLDPACGSGTFLVLAIKRLKEYADEHFVDTRSVIRHILRNVVGFDLNPLAVIASRTNYLLALGDLLREVGTTAEIPVFLADSIMVERHSTLTGDSYVLHTVVGDFEIPTSLSETETLSQILELISRCVNINCKPPEFDLSLKKEISKLTDTEQYLVNNLYKKFKVLEDEGKNRIWTGIIKNSFAPLHQGKFEYVVGNPPWIKWDNLPSDYRERTALLWKEYGLVKGSTIGKFKKDLAMLFVSTSYNQYLSDAGVMGFLMPFTLVKTQAGAGFRNFLANKCNVKIIHEMVDLAPFENAINRPSILILKKGKTNFPIECISWYKSQKGELSYNLSVEEVNGLTKQRKMVLEPIQGKHRPDSPWLIIDSKLVGNIAKIRGSSPYQAYSGVDTGLDSAFCIEIISKLPSCISIKNLHDVGKNKLDQIETVVEEKSIFRLIRGRDVKKWSVKPSGHILLLHDPKSGKRLDETEAKTSFPKTYSYFLKFKQNLENRGTHKLMGKGFPFYSAYKIGEYTFAPYKVVWKRIAGKISGKGEFSAAVITPSEDNEFGSQIAVPANTLLFIPFKSEEEAYFVCGILNCSAVRLIIAGYTIETEIPTNIPEYVKIPKYNSSNPLHLQIVELCKEAHKLTAKDNLKNVAKIQDELDELSIEIYGFKKSEMPLIQKALELIHD